MPVQSDIKVIKVGDSLNNTKGPKKQGWDIGNTILQRTMSISLRNSCEIKCSFYLIHVSDWVILDGDIKTDPSQRISPEGLSADIYFTELDFKIKTIARRFQNKIDAQFC